MWRHIGAASTEGVLKVTSLLHPDALGVPGNHGFKSSFRNPATRKGPHFNSLLNSAEGTFDPLHGGIDRNPRVRVYWVGGKQVVRYAMVIDLIQVRGLQCLRRGLQAGECHPARDLLEQSAAVRDRVITQQAQLHFLPMLCMHCQVAPCLEVCPTGATYRAEGGLVLVNDDLCVACRYCIMACPYEARSYNSTRPHEYYSRPGMTEFEQQGYQQHPKGSIEKCTFCVQRLREGKATSLRGDLPQPGQDLRRPRRPRVRGLETGGKRDCQTQGSRNREPNPQCSTLNRIFTCNDAHAD